MLTWACPSARSDRKSREVWQPKAESCFWTWCRSCDSRTTFRFCYCCYGMLPLCPTAIGLRAHTSWVYAVTSSCSSLRLRVPSLPPQVRRWGERSCLSSRRRQFWRPNDYCRATIGSGTRTSEQETTWTRRWRHRWPTTIRYEGNSRRRGLHDTTHEAPRRTFFLAVFVYFLFFLLLLFSCAESAPSHVHTCTKTSGSVPCWSIFPQLQWARSTAPPRHITSHHVT